MSFKINDPLNAFDALPNNASADIRKPNNNSKTNGNGQTAPDFEVYNNTSVAVAIDKNDTQFDFARRGLIEHARRANLTEAEQNKFADDMLAGRSRASVQLITDAGRSVGADKFSADKRAGKKEFYLSAKQLTELQNRQKESYAQRQTAIKNVVNSSDIKRMELARKLEAQMSAIPVD